jgi:hypothetical protein
MVKEVSSNVHHMVKVLYVGEMKSVSNLKWSDS